MNEKTVFFKMMADTRKDEVLLDGVICVNSNTLNSKTFIVSDNSIKKVPGSPYAYWISDKIRNLFKDLSAFEAEGRTVKQGLVTSDDFRFVRTSWEVEPKNEITYWVPFAKGGTYSPFYYDISVSVNWSKNGAEIKSEVDKRYSHIEGYQTFWVVKNPDSYFLPGLTWPLRASSFSPQIMPAGCIFSARGYAAQAPTEQLEWLLGILASAPFDYLFKVLLGRFEYPEFIVGVLQKLPLAKVGEKEALYFAELARRAWTEKYKLDQTVITSHAFVSPALIAMPGLDLKNRMYEWEIHLQETSATLNSIQSDIDSLSFHIYKFDEADRAALTNILISESTITKDEEIKIKNDLLSTCVTEIFDYMLGSVFGRWDVRYAIVEKSAPELPDPFAPLPICPPGMLRNNNELPITNYELEKDYPLEIVWDGISVDDAGHRDDIENRVRRVLELIFKDRAEAVENEATEILGVKSVRDYFRKPAGFFADHLKRYSKSRRQAPIYLPLSTRSGDYTLWLYYHRLTDQTLYTCVNDYVEPKLKSVQAELNILRSKTMRTTEEEKRFEKQQTFAYELEEMQNELLRLAAIWKPNLDDGVQITMSPLWKLFNLAKWQKALKETWQKLEKGDYDWAHLAFSLFSERVRSKCVKDKSLAIAHDLEDLYVEPPAKTKKKAGAKKADQTALEGLSE